MQFLEYCLQRGAFAIFAAIIFTTHAQASTPNAPVELRLGDATLDMTEGALSLSVPLEITTEAPEMAITLRVFLERLDSQEVDQTTLTDTELNLSEPLLETIRFSVSAPGDYGVRVIATPVDGQQAIGPSSAIQAYFRVTDDQTVDAFSLADYTHLRAEERRQGPGHMGLRKLHATGQYDETLDVDANGTSGDGLQLSRPRVNIGGGYSTFEVETESLEGSPAYVTIKGKLTTPINGSNYPLNFTRIEFWDKDPVKDDFLGATRTDNDGNYVITVNNDDGPFGGGVDVYLYIYSNQSDVSLLYLVPDGDGGYMPVYYAWTSPTHDNLDEKVVTIDYNITDNNLAATIWSGSEASAFFIESTASRQLNHVEVRYPPFGSGTHYINGIINIDPKYGDSPVTVGHEYGHAVMDQAYGGFPANSSGGHSLCEAASKGLAWSEGFATWYGLAAIGDSSDFSWHIGGNSVSIEKWYCGPKDATVDEGRTAAWIWDLYDIPKDSNGGNTAYGRNGYWDSNGDDSLVGSRTLLNTLWLGKQQDTTAYWTALQGELTKVQQGPSEQISQYNYLVE